MTFDYRHTEQTARRLLARFGLAAELARPGARTGPEYAPVLGPPSVAPCTVVLLDYALHERDGTLIRATDKRALISTAGLVSPVSVADKLMVGGVAHTIVRVEPLAPGGHVVLFTAQVRA